MIAVAGERPSRASAASVIEGTVRWPEGHPAANAEIDVIRQPAEKGDADFPPLPTHTTDAQGSFRTAEVDAGRYAVVARSIPDETSVAANLVGWWQATSEVEVPGGAPLDLVLGPLDSIRGRVLGLDGRAVESFHVRIEPRRKSGQEFDTRHGFGWSYDETSDGSFEMTGLLPGTWDVSIEPGEFCQPRAKQIEVPCHESLVFELVRTVELHGEVVDSAGMFVACVVSAAWEEQGESIVAGRASSKSGASGSFRLGFVAPTLVRVTATHQGVTGEPLLLDLTHGASREGVRLVLPRKP
jgi:hypothetical protein